MHVALIANTAWLDEELAVFRHLVVGLLDEQVRVAQVVPTGLSEEESIAFGERITWTDSSWNYLRRRRIRMLADALEELGVNLVHALDGRMWEGALDLAQALNVAAVFTANSAMDVTQARRLARQLDPSRTAFAAGTQPLAQAIEREVAETQVLVEYIPPGVIVPDGGMDQRLEQAAEQAAESSPSDTHPLCAVITGNGRYDDDYEALCAALASILKEHPQSQFFLDGMGDEQHQLWQAAQRHNLLANLSFVPRRLGHRELLLRADLLLQPQALGRTRSITLQAMAAGKPVIARNDPWLDYLIDDTTAWVIDDAAPEPWVAALRRAFEHPEQARQLGRSARQWIRHNRPVSRHVDHTRMLYHRVTGEGIKFPG